MDTPWWSNLIAVVVTAIVSVVGTLYALTPRQPGEAVGAASTVGSFFKDTITYIPHILLLYGVLADMFTYQGVFSIPSLIGLLSIIANKIFAYVWKGLYSLGEGIGSIFKDPAAQTGGAAGDFFKDYDGCTVQGFAWAESPYAPQTLVVTATVFLYYIFDIVTNRGWGQAAGSIAMFILLFLGQVFIIGDCPPQGEGLPGKWTRALFSLTEGAIFGGIGFSVVQSLAPERMPTKGYSMFPKVNRKDLKEGPDGTLVDDKGIPYMVMPDGSAIPDMSSVEGKQKFGEFLGAKMGTGATALPDSCKR
jgi:hypothetical protein